MRLIIAGKRTFPNRMSGMIKDILDIYGLFEIVTEIVEGGAKGVDASACYFAEKVYGFPTKRFSADWETHGKAAGPIRNRQMAEYADALLLIWDGKSRGSANMKKEMQKLGKAIYEVVINKTEKESEGEL